jgi:hypothetical protein
VRAGTCIRIKVSSSGWAVTAFLPLKDIDESSKRSEASPSLGENSEWLLKKLKNVPSRTA